MKINLEKLCSPAIWAEGSVWLPSENAIIFSDVKGNQMFRWSEGDNVSLWRHNSNYVNGNAKMGWHFLQMKNGYTLQTCLLLISLCMEDMSFVSIQYKVKP